VSRFERTVLQRAEWPARLGARDPAGGNRVQWPKGQRQPPCQPDWTEERAARKRSRGASITMSIC